MTRLEIATALLATASDFPDAGVTAKAFNAAELILAEESRRMKAEEARIDAVTVRQWPDGTWHKEPPPKPDVAPPSVEVPLLENARRCRACLMDWFGPGLPLPDQCPQCGGELEPKKRNT